MYLLRLKRMNLQFSTHTVSKNGGLQDAPYNNINN